MADIFRMAHVLKGNAGMGTEEGGADLGNQFFKGIAEITKPGAEHPVQPAGMARPVADLVVASAEIKIASSAEFVGSSLKNSPRA